MPSYIFANTGTNVSVIFIDKTNKDDTVTLVDASKLGEKIKEGKNQRTIIRAEEEQKIIDAFLNMEAIENFSVKVGYNEIKEKDYSLSAGPYFDVKIEHVDITEEELWKRVNAYKNSLTEQFSKNERLEKCILEQMERIKNANR